MEEDGNHSMEKDYFLSHLSNIFIDMVTIPKEIIYIVYFNIAVKSYTLWNWKFCHETPWWRKSIIVIGQSVKL